MIHRYRVLGHIVFVSALSIAGCDRDPPPPAQQAQPAPVPAPSAQVPAEVASAPPPPAPSKPDAVNLDSLKAGLDTMTPRIVAQVDGYKKIEPDNRYRFFMHPDEKKAASIEFDTKGLTSISLSPFMADFSSDQGCVANPQAGVARLTWLVDGKKKGSVMVDRDYNALVNVDLTKSTRLKLEVDNGNGVIWCDWFTVGMVNVK